jgi:hypothetical protein
VKKRRDLIPTRTPDRRWFVRTNPDPDFRTETQVLEDKGGFTTTIYTVEPALWDELVVDLTPKLLVSTISADGVSKKRKHYIDAYEEVLAAASECARIGGEACARTGQRWARIHNNTGRLKHEQSLIRVFSLLVNDYVMALSAGAVWESWSVGRAAGLVFSLTDSTTR